MKILIISYYFPPYITLGSIRPGKMAKYFIRQGHEVRVIAAKEPLLAGQIPKTLELEIPVSYVSYTDWFDINKFSRTAYQKIFKRKNLPITFHHHSSKDNNKFFQRISQSIRSIINIPDAKYGWKSRASKRADEIIEKWKPDIIYATALPLTSIIIGSTIAKKYKIPFVAEFRDLWVDSHDYAFQKWRKKIDRIIERNALSNANVIITVSEPLAQTLRQSYHKNVEVIHNGFDNEDFNKIKSNKSPAKRLTLSYMGTFYYPYQDPKILFEAIKDFSCEELSVQFYTSEICMGYIQAQAELFGVLDKVTINKIVPHEQAIEIQLHSDILIHFLWDNPKQKGIMSAKLLEYIGADRTIYVLGAKNDISELIVNSRIGIHFDNVEQLKNALNGAMIKKRSGESFTSNIPNEIKTQFSRRHQAEQLIKIFEKILHQS